MNGEFRNNHFSAFGRQQKQQQQQYKIIIINYKKKKKKCRAAGQIGCQATRNSPGSPDGQSALAVDQETTRSDPEEYGAMADQAEQEAIVKQAEQDAMVEQRHGQTT